MKTSFSTLACPDWSFPEVLAVASKCGYDGVELRVISRELDLWKMPEFKSSALANTRRAIEDHGLVVAAVGSSACFHSPDAEERERNIDSALRMAEIAAGLGAPAIRVFGDRIQPGSTRQQTAAWIVDSLLRVTNRLKAGGPQIWLETHGDFASSADVEQLFSHVDNQEVGIIWDPVNAFAQTGESPNISNQISSRIKHVHLKDLRRDAYGEAHYVLTGEGEFPFQAMFSALAEIAFDGFISFEWEKLWHPELAPPEIALPHFMEWWSEWKEREVA
jgi:sugar phosphate isomerase/epimerase